jgi:peptidoglycan-associated lipoprotein
MSNIFFLFGSWELTPDSEEGLKSLVKLLNDNPNITIELAAHTDLVGQNEANQELSLRRAQTVVDYLIRNGIEQERLTAVGYGEEKPVVVDEILHKQYPYLPKDQVLDEAFITTLTAEQQELCNSLNRRTEFRVLKTTYNLY